jgi:ATP-dependent RNA helicase RhlE
MPTSRYWFSSAPSSAPAAWRIYLERQGIAADAIHGDKNQQQRTEALEGFKSGKVRVLVATDVAARGLDIDDLPHVINYELPHTAEDYVHRIGRTGRAGKHGDATSLFAPEETQRLADIEKLIKRKIERVEISGFAELVSAPVESAPPSNRGHKPRTPRTRARESPRTRPRADPRRQPPAGRELPSPAGRELPTPAAHVPRFDPRLPKLDFDPNKPYVNKAAAGGEPWPPPKAAPSRPQRPVAALLGGLGKKP